MRYAISIPPAGPPADLVACAVAAEHAGWDAFFLWDHVYGSDGMPLHDPWVLLGAIGAATDRVRLGAMVTPLARRRPWKVAKEVITLDQLTGGRVVVGVGLGIPDSDFTAFGESADPRTRAATLDEALVVLDGLLRGAEVDHAGPRFQVRARLTPGSVQRPRPPIWVAATWPHRRPLARAARYDGVFALGRDAVGGLTPDQVAEVRAILGPDRDIVLPYDPAVPIDEHAAAGVTWSVIGPDEPSGDWLAALRRRIEAGPPG
ncbi:LLM class flavin-dependent oxidoreductase [Plantactinospora solaniradicis]|uniref:LLM class flavin-dependent oxidoreductase n=1 Tax=Plantactinospora solaniradicis TaxID=1723736 RepID=A0ABW1K4A2_9ACTN